MKILFIQTGGTIDKDYPRSTGGWAFEFGEPAIERMLVDLNPSFDYEVVTAFQKDSLEVSEKDRRILADLINAREETKIIITHGTDTMIDTANYLSSSVSDRVVVLTGAMRPERFQNSDADLNVGCAIAALSLAKPGIYIAMHGIVKPWNEMKRNLETGQFY